MSLRPLYNIPQIVGKVNYTTIFIFNQRDVITINDMQNLHIDDSSFLSSPTNKKGIRYFTVYPTGGKTIKGTFFGKRNVNQFVSFIHWR